MYNYLTGHSEVTAQRHFVALRKCVHERRGAAPCTGKKGWKYLTGSADSTEVRVGLLNTPGHLVVSPIDDRLFVASGPCVRAGPASRCTPAWLVSFEHRPPRSTHLARRTGDVGLTQQELLLYPTHVHRRGRRGTCGRGFLPLVVNRHDWSISPLNVPSDASAAMPVHQPDTGQIWIGGADNG